MQECWEALNSMINCKTPGNDGLTKEFYVCFFKQLDKLLVSTFNYSFDHGEMRTSQKQAIIVLIQRKDGDSRLIKNWRPISLMNVDAKIASKALAMRIKKTIYKLVHTDQTAYITGHFIGESVRLIEDLLEYADQENEDGILFAADIEKGFDSVEHSFIYATLKKFGFFFFSFFSVKFFFAHDFCGVWSCSFSLGPPLGLRIKNACKMVV